jgi:alkaline phosphatase
MTKSISVLLISILFFGCELEKPKLSLKVDKKERRAKNIIIMIADGCGYNHIAATNYYSNGELNSQVYESFPVQFPVSTSPALSGKFKTENGLSWQNGYNSGLTYSDSLWRNKSATGSGSAATAIASGRKTYNASIGMDIYFQPLKSIAEKAKELGKSAGLVTSVPFAHATPASFASHNVHRDNYEEIARELIISNMDIIFGCGHPDFDDDGKDENSPDYKYVGGKEFWNNYISGKNYGRKLITKQSEFEKLLLNPTEDRLLGLPRVHSTLQVGRGGNVNASPNQVEFTKKIPSLKLLSNTALSSLNQNPKGFFLMVEGGAVDWAAHSNQSGRMIEELNSFNKAVESVVKWIETNSSWDETLLIVTSDHETGYLTGTKGYNSIIESNGKGALPKMQWNSNHHTNVLIPLYAKGVGSELFDDYADEIDSLRGYFIQNSEIGQVMFRMIVK